MNRMERVNNKALAQASRISIGFLALFFVSCGGGSSDTHIASVGPTSSPSSIPASSPNSSTTSAPQTGASNVPATTGTPTPVSDVLTYHNDLARTGQYLAETVLTPANVRKATFGKVALLATDGKVDAEPLYASGVMIGGVGHNVVYVVSEHATAYAFDADSNAELWHRSLLGAGETTYVDRNCGQIAPEIGITSTPVIDRTRGAAGVLYAVATSKDANGAVHQRLHAVDLATGSEALSGPVDIAAQYPGTGANSTNGVTVFDPAQYAERQALTLVGGSVYLGWTSHCDLGAYGGWVMAYNAGTLAQQSVLNVTPNGIRGSVWMSGAGMASDGTFLYLLDANGTFDATLDANGRPANGDYGNAFLKLSGSPALAVADYFATFDTVAQSAKDADLGSGGALLLPDVTDANNAVRHLAVGAGKDSKIYIVDRDSMGGFSPSANRIWQEIDGQLAGGIFSMPAYYNNVVFFGAVGDTLKAFPINAAKLATSASSHSPSAFAYPGTTPSISANGGSNGIVWAAENGTAGALHAFDASDLTQEIYNSNQSGTRDTFGAGNKFVTPMIAHGHVYVGATNGVVVFGLL